MGRNQELINKAKIDYNKISSVYNERYKISPLSGIQVFLENLVSNQPLQNILEVGCGTGHWLSVISKLNRRLYGIDYSVGMLKQVNSSGSFLLNADANLLPIKENSFDLIYCVNAIHQFNNPFQFVKDVNPLLKHNGQLSIIGYDPFAKNTKWYLYDYFPETYQIDLKRYPKFDDISTEMIKHGFTNIFLKNVDSVYSFKKSHEILDDHFLDKKGSSQLALLSEEQYRAGLEKIKMDIEKSKKVNTELHFETNLSFYSITGTKH